MTSDVKVYISMKDGGERRLTVDGSMSMVIDLLRQLGREVLEERERAALQDAASCAPAPVSDPAAPAEPIILPE